MSAFHNSDRQWIAVFIFCTAIIGVAEVFGVTQPLRNLGELAITPLESLSAQIVLGLRTPLILAKQAYKADIRIQDLERRYSETLAELGKLEGVAEENRQLRAALLQTEAAATAERLFVSPILSYGLPSIGVGSVAGVRESDPIVINGILVGRVTGVHEYQAGVALLQNNTTEPILAKIANTAITGLVVGNGRDILLTEVASDQKLAEGDRVITAGQPGLSPGITIGIVQRLLTKPEDAVQTAVIAQSVSYFESRLVEVRIRL